MEVGRTPRVPRQVSASDPFPLITFRATSSVKTTRCANGGMQQRDGRVQVHTEGFLEAFRNTYVALGDNLVNSTLSRRSWWISGKVLRWLLQVTATGAGLS